ncbi:hypothetical protein M407DRAFT_244727 [Tulasnella calospora MUT 4182]|uniref:Uncharacterized protein n=1 Tax=Tulasnella calospora MUT 4182 TaxID=1051891 RepID=A0A0C3Q414_9AGAM|nr:hypothetical protein M407DRAFT_244727 [Tulasnella calospora MUT 4182]
MDDLSTGFMGNVLDYNFWVARFPAAAGQRGLAARWNILGIITLMQGLLTMGLSWMIFFRSETSLLTANDAQTNLLEHVSREKLARLEVIKDRIGKLGNRSAAAAEMLIDIESVIFDCKETLTHCEDLAKTNALERWRTAKEISQKLQELESRARDPTHTMNLVLSGVFALLEIAGSEPNTPQKPLVEI